MVSVHTTKTFGTLGPHVREAATKVSQRLGYELGALTARVSEERRGEGEVAEMLSQSRSSVDGSRGIKGFLARGGYYGRNQEF